jgi:hypothetical protein
MRGGAGVLLCGRRPAVAAQVRRRAYAFGEPAGHSHHTGVMAVGTDTKAVLATCAVVAGLFIGISNTLIT